MEKKVEIMMLRKNDKKKIIVKFVKYSGNKTIKVVIESLKKHSKYRKYIRSSKHLLIHYDGDENLTLGDNLVIENCRPISKSKRHRFVRKVNEVIS